MACLSAPLSVCMALSICAVASITVPLAISDGWNWKPSSAIHLCAPFVDCPATNTQRRVMSEMIIMNGVTILKYLHFMFSVTTMHTMPISNSAMCLSIGAM